MMTQKSTTHRRATALLLAAAALPFTPAFAQDAAPPTDPPVVDVTPPPVATPPPEESVPVADSTTPASPVAAPTLTAPPQSVVTQPVVTQPVVTTPPPTVPEAAPVRRTARSTTQRSTTQVRTAAPAPRQAAPAAAALAPASETAAPLAATPPGAVPAPEALPVEAAPTAGDNRVAGLPWTLLAAGAALLLAMLAFFAWRRRRTRDEVYDDYVDQAPVAPVAPVEEPMVVAPAAFAAADSVERQQAPFVAEEGTEAAPVIEELHVADADSADVEALAAGSEAPAGRPWIEFLMRPIRAGANEEEAVVEFELTVGNTGSVPARDVRISTWMFAAGSAQDSEMERMLIEAPADASVSEASIDAGDATRLEAKIALPRTGLDESVLPVVVADARYRLPDGSEGRTAASFAVGLAEGEEISPFRVDDRSGLHEDIGSRLHGELQRA